MLSDDGSKIFIDNELIVDNDGIHWLNEAYGAVKLEKGFHKINISYFDQVGGTTLNVSFNRKEKKNRKLVLRNYTMNRKNYPIADYFKFHEPKTKND